MACWGFVLVYEDSIRYTYYKLNVTFPDSAEENQFSKSYIGDVQFKYEWRNEAFTEEELSLRMIYLVITTIAIFIFFLKIRTIPLGDWSIEQISVAALLASLIALNSMLKYY